MMKLLCINARELMINGIRYLGKDLVEGQIYTTRGEVYKDGQDLDNYYIDEVNGERLARRFTRVHKSDDDSESERAFQELKEELNLS